MIELLSPAGSKEAFLAAVNSGADAVYLGLKKFSARGNAENFSEEDLIFCVNYAKLFGVKVYAAVNTLIKNGELDDFFACVAEALSAGVDAIILQDMFLGKTLKKMFPEIVLHLSTQAGVCNMLGARLAAEYGFSRVILARETRFEDIEKIAAFIETEVFVQGALCSSFSGHCYMSSFIGGNSGNRGLCKQPCRKKYAYTTDGRTQSECYALSLSDLSIGKDIGKYIAAGVKSFKIEGRMRRKEYVAAATRYYRELIDQRRAENRSFSSLRRTYNRNDYTKGLAFGQDKNFLSTRVQGHIGEYTGTVERKISNEEYFVKGEQGVSGDAYKVFRNGAEIGTGIFKENVRGGMILKTNGAAFSAGDRVNITTDIKINEELAEFQKKYRLEIFSILSQNARARFLILLCGEETAPQFSAAAQNEDALDTLAPEKLFDLLSAYQNGEKRLTDTEVNLFSENLRRSFGSTLPANFISALIKNNFYFFYEGVTLPAAQTQALSESAVCECFSKTGEYPFYTELHLITNGVFLPKSALNEIRRGIYAKAFSYFNKADKVDFCKYTPILPDIKTIKNICILQNNFNINMYAINSFVFIPKDYSDRDLSEHFIAFAHSKNAAAYLFLPAFASGEDLEILKKLVPIFDGVYADSPYGLKLGEEQRKNIIAGLGLNVFNSVDTAELNARGIASENIVLSKELSASEISEFKGGSYLAAGKVALMDLIYCPFKKQCLNCNKNEILLKDDCGRTYNVLKYKLSDCRFIVYNPYDLREKNIAEKGKVYDFTFQNDSLQKTNGNLVKGVI